MRNIFINNDCLNAIPRIEQKFDAIISDIPYFQVVENDWDNQWKSVDEYLNWVEEIIRLCQNVCKENASIMLFTGRQYNRQISCILDKYFTEQRIIIWARRNNINTTRGKALASGYEPLCYYTQGSPTFNTLKIKPDTKRKEYVSGVLSGGITLSDVWSDIPYIPHNSREKVNHPTQKPIKLMQRCIELCTKPGDYILDFCSGSGTTGVAAKILGRNSYCIEKDEEYHKIACQRYKEFFRENPDEF